MRAESSTFLSVTQVTRWPLGSGFSACGSKVLYVFMLPIFALRAKIGNKK
jgi:hypothetical protein